MLNIVITLLITTISIFGAEETKLNLFFSENHVDFDTPIIVHKQKSYVPSGLS